MEYLILLIVCLSTISSADNSTHFIYPPDSSNLTFHYGDTVDVEWTSTYLFIPGSGPYLSLWCGSSNLLPFHIDASTNGTEPVAFIDLNFAGFSLPIECRFVIQYNLTSGNASATFTLDEQNPNVLPYTWAATMTTATNSVPSSSVTTASTSTTSKTTQVATRSVITVQSITATATTPSRSNGLGPGAKVGVGVGCTVSGLFLLAALAYLLLRSKTKSGGQKISLEPPRRDDVGNNMVYQKAELSNEQRRHELPEALQHELSGESQLHEFPGE